MKKVLLSAVALLAFGFANAQEKSEETKSYGFSKGSMYVEGSISFQTSDSDGDLFAFNPKFGYFISDKFAVGGDLNISTEKQIDDDKVKSFGGGVFARYNFLNLHNNRFVTYAEAGLGFNSTKFEDGITGATSTDNGIKANVNIGLNYFITPKLAATFQIAEILSYNNANPEFGDNSSDFRLNINLFNNIFAQPKFGLLYKF